MFFFYDQIMSLGYNQYNVQKNQSLIFYLQTVYFIVAISETILNVNIENLIVI